MSTHLPVAAQTLSAAQQAQIVNLVRRGAKAEILPRFQNLSQSQIEAKSRPDDLVTEADLASEAMITRGLRRLFPDAMVVGEEAVAKDGSLRQTMAEHAFAFVIDPIDGTWNYAKGIPLFGVILSVLRYGTPIFGLLYDPNLRAVPRGTIAAAAASDHGVAGDGTDVSRWRSVARPRDADRG